MKNVTPTENNMSGYVVGNKVPSLMSGNTCLEAREWRYYMIAMISNCGKAGYHIYNREIVRLGLLMKSRGLRSNGIKPPKKNDYYQKQNFGWL